MKRVDIIGELIERGCLNRVAFDILARLNLRDLTSAEGRGTRKCVIFAMRRRRRQTLELDNFGTYRTFLKQRAHCGSPLSVTRMHCIIGMKKGLGRSLQLC